MEYIEITPQERKEMATGSARKPAKYTFYALNNAVKYSSANSKSNIGNIQEIYGEFEEVHPNGSFRDWQNFYYNQHDGRERLEQATDEAYDMFLTIRASIDQVDREDVRDFIEGLVLNGTYSSHNAREATVEKILKSVSESERVSPGEGPEECELKIGTQFFTVQPEEMRSESLFEGQNDVSVFYYEENERDSGLTVDISKRNMSLDNY